MSSVTHYSSYSCPHQEGSAVKIHFKLAYCGYSPTTCKSRVSANAYATGTIHSRYTSPTISQAIYQGETENGIIFIRLKESYLKLPLF